MERMTLTHPLQHVQTTGYITTTMSDVTSHVMIFETKGDGILTTHGIVIPTDSSDLETLITLIRFAAWSVAP